ncbi:glutamine--fructose-6-phosphate transaminase (isomerizing), partial [Pseudomonadota bacterium]
MCGIVGAVAKYNIVPILMEGLHRLEYRGYDSAGLVVLENNKLERTRSVGKVGELQKALNGSVVRGFTGIAHTRWATHGKPTENNAHPHISGETVAVVCNGIIENHEELRQQQILDGFQFHSETDTEVVVHQIYGFIREGDDLLTAVTKTVNTLRGAFAIGVISAKEPDRLVASRRGSPLVVGLANSDTYIASDKTALLNVTKDFMVLQDGDIADISAGAVTIFNQAGETVDREISRSNQRLDAIELGDFRHYMQKEIFEQTQAVADTLEGRITGDRLLEGAFGPTSKSIFDHTKSVQILACGTSHHAGLVARHWMEGFGVPCNVEIASEFRYRRHVVPEGALVVTISQSGETADTLAALAEAKRIGFQHSLVICNVPESSLVRESDLTLMTHAGPEIGVASTKAFTTQLTALMLLCIALGRRHGLTAEKEAAIVKELRTLPAKIEHVLKLDPTIES